ncbi:GNAT family N-acetyltransferase [Mycobacterium sp. ACS4331]|uniref:GNAT family N-acetyltransferase n=1 Tax=Mycobacterium sp. ACS4331 TaxID=1834121 RepID=UPI000800A10C|nr:GNAT family N-acetyltransferase [Mycobacterium sp. ACS4331]OBF18461.1 acetyltransferase [Mycobacterium sp. ACS4331]
MTLADKTGAPVTITKDADRFLVRVEGQDVGMAQFAERGGQRVFFHTEVDEAFGGRGLATILIGEALAATRAEGRRIVPVCPMVAAYVRKHHEFDDITDSATPEIMRTLQ